MCTSIIKIQVDALKKIIETKYKNVFEVESDNQQLGMCFKDIYDNILEAKKSKEIGNDLKLMLRNNLIIDLSRDQHCKTEKDLDYELKGYEDDLLEDSSVDNISVKSETDIMRNSELPEHLNMRRTSTRPLKKSKTINRKNQSSEALNDLMFEKVVFSGETLVGDLSPPQQ